MLAEVSASSEDVLKLLLLVVAGGGLLALGRWSSRLAVGRIDESPSDTPTPDVKELLGNALSAWPSSAEGVAASLPFDPALRRIQIKKFFFDKTDVVPGPDDPEVFAEELHIQLYDPDSDHDWWQSYFVATPRGITKILQERSWRYLHAPEILVFPRYDLEEIRRAVVSRIMADHEFFRGKEQGKEETL
jgi:hypothetical protein